MAHIQFAQETIDLMYLLPNMVDSIAAANDQIANNRQELNALVAQRTELVQLLGHQIQQNLEELKQNICIKSRLDMRIKDLQLLIDMDERLGVAIEHLYIGELIKAPILDVHNATGARYASWLHHTCGWTGVPCIRNTIGGQDLVDIFVAFGGVNNLAMPLYRRYDVHENGQLFFSQLMHGIPYNME